MTKKILLLAGLLFCLSIIGVMLGYFWGEQVNRAHLVVGTSGGNVQVYLDQHHLGLAPIKDYLTPSGAYDLTLVTDYYNYTTPIQMYPQTVTVVDWTTSDGIAKTSGVIYELSPRLDKQTALKVTSLPDRAAFSVDEAETTFFTPIEIADLEPTTHQLQVTLPGYKTQTIPFTLTAGYTLKLTVKLGQDN
jgi:Flp pilus assembly protein TadG